jgi:hypothetical protein
MHASQHQHSKVNLILRRYHQQKQQHNIRSEPITRKRNKNGLIPVTTLEPPAPERLLKLTSCKCKKRCQKACGCRKGIPR